MTLRTLGDGYRKKLRQFGPLHAAFSMALLAFAHVGLVLGFGNTYLVEYIGNKTHLPLVKEQK